MIVQIKHNYKTILKLTSTPSMSITEIKEKIKETTSYSLKIQHLFYKHQEIKDGHLLSDYNIKKDVIFNLVILKF